MSNDARLKIVIDALNSASSELKELQTQLGDVDEKSKKAGSGMKDLNEGAAGAIEQMTGLSISSLGVAGAMTAVVAALKSTLDKTGEYAVQVEDLARSMGSNTEEASKLIQVADDARVSYETLTIASKELIKGGITPNIENMAKLSDEYRAMQDPVAKGQFLLDRFGKSGLEMAKFMEMGGAAIKAAADEAEGMGLVMDSKAVASAENFRLSVDNLEDTLTGLQYQLGPPLMDVLSGGIEGFQNFVKVMEAAKIAILQQTGAMSDQEAAWRATQLASGDLLAVYREYNPILIQAEEATAAYGESLDESNRLLRDHEPAAQTAADAEAILKKAFDDNSASVKALTSLIGSPLQNELEKYGDKQRALKDEMAATQAELDRLMASQGQVVTVNHEAAGSAEEVFLAQDKALALTYQLGDAQQKLAEQTDPDKQHEAAVRVAELQVAFDAATKKVNELTGSTETWTVNNSKDINEQKAKLQELQAEYRKNADEHEKATRQIMFNMLQQQAATDGFTTEEVKLLTKVAENWGMVDATTAAVTQGISDALAEANSSKEWQRAYDTIDLLTQKLGMVPKDLMIKVGVQQVGSAKIPGFEFDSDAPLQPTKSNDNPNKVYGGGNGTVGGLAEGGAFTMPGGGLFDKPVLMGLRGGEQVTVITPEDITSRNVSAGGANGAGMTSWTGNVVINGADDPQATAAAVIRALQDRGLLSQTATR